MGTRDGEHGLEAHADGQARAFEVIGKVDEALLYVQTYHDTRAPKEYEALQVLAAEVERLRAENATKHQQLLDALAVKDTALREYQGLRDKVAEQNAELRDAQSGMAAALSEYQGQNEALKAKLAWRSATLRSAIC